MELSLHKTYQEIERSHWWFVGRRRIVFDLLARFVNKEHPRVLDFGCNAGLFVGQLLDRGFEAYGVDVSTEAISYGREQGIRNLSVMSADRGGRLPFPDTHFDAVLALDVLEHIEDDAGALSEIRRVLKPAGVFITMVPALPILWGVQDTVSHHFRRYRRSELSALLAHGGFSVRRISYFNFFLFPPIFLVRLFQKIRKPKRASDFELNNRFVNAVLTAVFLCEATLLRVTNFFIGVSLLCVVTKNEN